MLLTQGMIYIHNSAIGSHGRLKSTNVVIDSRWICKITDYGLTHFLHGEKSDTEKTQYAEYAGK